MTDDKILEETTRRADNIMVQTWENIGVSFIELPAGINLRDKSLSAWADYFDVFIKEGDDFHILRAKLARASNLIDECRTIHAHLKLSFNRMDLEEFLFDKIGTTIGIDLKKTIVGAKRTAEHNSMVSIGSKKGSKMLLSFWEEMIEKLKSKLKVLEVLIYSQNGEMKSLGRFTSDED